MGLSQKAQLAIEHARRTSGALQWTPSGVFTLDGKFGLEPACRESQQVREYLKKKCALFSGVEMERERAKKIRRVNRYRELAIRALTNSQWSAARELSQRAEWANEEATEIYKRRTVYFRLPEVTR